MKVLVTGGAGFIASHIVDALLDRGHAVAVVDNLSTGKERNLNPRASFHRVDIRDLEALEAVFAQEHPDLVDHHAAQADVRRSMADPGYDVSVNVLGTLHVVHLAHKFGARRVVFASTCAIYPESERLPFAEDHPLVPVSIYGLSKQMGEQHLRFFHDVYGLGFTVFRYANVYGPRQDPKGEAGVVAIFCEQMLAGVQPTIFGDGHKTRDYVYVEDVVAANLLALDGKVDGEVMNIGWGREVTDFEVFDGVRRNLGVSLEPKYAPRRLGEMERVALDAAKARRLLDWTPTVPFEQGIERAVAFYKRRRQEPR